MMQIDKVTTGEEYSWNIGIFMMQRNGRPEEQ